MRLLVVRVIEGDSFAGGSFAPRFSQPLLKPVGGDRHVELPVSIIAFQRRMDLLAHKHGGRRRRPDAVDVAELDRQRAPQPAVQPTRRNVFEDAGATLISGVSIEEFDAHAAAPLRTWLRSICPVLIALSASISPLASRLDKPAIGLPNIRCDSVSSR